MINLGQDDREEISSVYLSYPIVYQRDKGDLYKLINRGGDQTRRISVTFQEHGYTTLRQSLPRYWQLA